MSLAAGLSACQSQRLALGPAMSLLRLSSAELAAHLAEAAQENPCLVLRPPRRRAPPRGLTAAMLERREAPAGGLHAHVAAELGPLLARGDPLSRVIGALVEELEPSGWMTAPPGGIAARLGIGEHLVLGALKLVQARVSPTGLFARDLAECLALQLEERGALDARMRALLAHLPSLEREGPAGLARRAGLGAAETAEGLALLRGLDPKPGARFDQDPAAMREPDAMVARAASGGGWRLRFNRDAEPAVEIAPPGSGGAGGAALAEALRDARRLRDALALRRSATRQVVGALVAAQTGYLARGIAGLRPLAMADLAARTGFHPSTVGRALHGYLIETPHGLVEARTLCPGAVSRAGAHCPAQAMARIRAILGAEDPRAPLSDAALAARLQAEGMAISRRVAAKYRDGCGLPRAALRRRPA